MNNLVSKGSTCECNLLKWFLTSILSESYQDSCQYLACKITQDSDMILVKNLVIILLARLTQDSWQELPKILDKNYPRFLTRITQDSDMILLNYLVKSLVIILLSWITQDTNKVPWQDPWQEWQYVSWVNLTSKILKWPLDKILDKHHVKIFGNSCKQDTNKVPWKVPWQELCQNLG